MFKPFFFSFFFLSFRLLRTITASGPWTNRKRKNMQVLLGHPFCQICQTFTHNASELCILMCEFYLLGGRGWGVGGGWIMWTEIWAAVQSKCKCQREHFPDLDIRGWSSGSFWRTVAFFNPLSTGQDIVFQCLGESLLHNAFLGYNACIFAYGQTGERRSIHNHVVPWCIAPVFNLLFYTQVSRRESDQIRL